MAQLEYVENAGQWDDAVHFRMELGTGAMWVEESALTYIQLSDAYFSRFHNDNPQELSGSIGHAWKMNFVGGNSSIAVAKNQKPHYYNYHLGNDPSRWASGVHPSTQGLLKEMYPGIDVLMHASDLGPKYDFKVAPGVDPSVIILEYEGLDGISFRDGDLVLKTSIGEVIEKAPFAFQLIDGSFKEVECSYQLDGFQVRFELGEYDPEYPLTIDPEISFSTYIGSPSSNFGFTAADDADGNMIAGAAVFGAGYQTTVGAIDTEFVSIIDGYMDVAVSKFNEDGSALIYSTYLGGEGLEMPHSIVGDNDGNYIVMGTTGSNTFPTTIGAYQTIMAGGPEFSFASIFVSASHAESCDFFLTKFSGVDDTLEASTYVGGYGLDGINVGDNLAYNYGDLFRGEVNVDDQGRIYVASCTQSINFPMAGTSLQDSPQGELDAIVFRLDPSLSQLQYATYLGGTGHDAAYAVQLDSDENLVVSGGTKSPEFPMSNGSPYDPDFNGDVDAFIIKFAVNSSAPAGSTFYGTSNYDQAHFLQLDPDDNIYIYGQSDGDLEITPGQYGNANSGQFIAKFNSELTNLEWQTTIGSGDGQIDISPTAFLVSDCDQIYIAGWGGNTNQNNSLYATSSSTENLPITAEAFQSDTDGSDFYLAVLQPDATDLVYATYFGGGTSTEHVDGGTARFDRDGSVYQAVCAGCGGNSDFPTTPNAWSAVNPSSNCNLGVFKFDLGKINADIQIEGPTEICEGQPADFINNTVGGDAWEWSFGDNNMSGEFEPDHIYESDG
ncbi:MAG: hypothetical protein HRT74_02490, partial [Flavobacteriales bacterium]|nr:hypothetical protein [Flavobacteriales bacterium]